MVLIFSSQINRIAVSASKNEHIREELIRDQEKNILRTASNACRKYITKSDDEWSLALGEFSRAIDIYTEDKGDFLPFAQMLIKRKLIDSFKKHNGTFLEVSTSPMVLEGNAEPSEDTAGVCLKLAEKSREASDMSLKDEITEVNAVLKSFGFRFLELTECSPKQEKTRRECGTAARFVIDHEESCLKLKRTGKLPVNDIVKGTGVSRKTLDRYRKYIIMAVVILNGDYPHIAEYLKDVRKEESK